MNLNQKKKTSSRDFFLQEQELAENPNPRVPITVCVDVSFSMLTNDRLNKVKKGLEQFLNDMRNDQIAKGTVELCIISYGGNGAQIVRDFGLVTEQIRVPLLNATGGTPLVEAIELALDNLADRKNRYDRNAITQYKPWLILIGDGGGDYDANMNQVKRRLKEESARLNVFFVTVGEAGKRDSTMMRLSPEGKIHYLADLKFVEFFSWLSRGLTQQSKSMRGEEQKLEPTTTWAEEIRE